MKKPTFFGKYLLLERINVGGMAEIFIAKAFGVEGFERILAIKKILPTMAEDQEFITMFKDEARISLQLNHANIVRTEELGRYEDNYFLAMEYVAGRDVRSLIERHRRHKRAMPAQQAAFIASRMCEGLDYAHRRKDARGRDLQIVHRDVSPQNVLVSYEGEVKLIDFGIAKAANRDQKTQAGILKGKFGYMSPEQVRGHPVDRRSDVFAVGVLLYEMLTGERLFVGESDFSTLEKVRNAEIPLPTQLNPDIPPGLERVMLKALARAPEERYQWASELQEDLIRFLLAEEILYSSKLLASFMQETFGEELRREAERMERYAGVERPDALEPSGVTTGALRSPARAAAQPSAAPSAPMPSPRAASGGDDLLSSEERTQIFDPSMNGAPQGRREHRDAGPTAVIVASAPRAAPFHSASGARAPGEEAPLPVVTTIFPEDCAPVAIGAAGVVGPEETVIGRPPPRRRPAPATRARASPAQCGGEPEASGALRPTTRTPGAVLRAVAASSRVGCGALSRQHGLKALGAAVVVLLLGGGVRLAQLPRSGSLLVLVRPAAGAQVQVDGRAIDPNAIVSLPVGRRRVSASAPGHAPVERDVDIQEGETPPVLELALRPLPALSPVGGSVVRAAPAAGAAAVSPPAVREAPLAVPPATQASPTFAATFVGEPGAEVSVDGRPVGRTPAAKVGNLAIGRRYAFTVTRAGYRPFVGHFHSEREAQVEVAFRLEREAALLPTVARRAEAAPTRPANVVHGRLACSTQPAGAQVWVDGRNSGRLTPVALGNPLLLPVGPHTVVFKLNGKQSPPAPVTITEEAVVKLVNVPLD